MAKNNEVFWRRAKILLIIAGIIASIAMAYEKVNNHEKTLDKHALKIDNHEKAVVEIRTDIKYIREGIKDIREKME